MIKNEKQYKIAKAKLEKWLKNLELVKNGSMQSEVADWVFREQVFGIEEQVKQLLAELEEYDDIASGKRVLPDPSLVDQIPELLISWRIARRMTQRELAERAGIHENLLQKYEAENYGGASYRTITHIAHILKSAESTEHDCSHT